MFIGGLPFMMVAIVELCKIPLATAVFHAKRFFWKMMFTISLLLLVVITFETVLIGMEQNFSTRTYVIGQTNQILLETNEAIVEKERELTTQRNISEDQIRQDFSKERETISNARAVELNELDQDELNINAGRSTMTLDSLRNQLDSVNIDFANLEQKEIKEISDLRNFFYFFFF